MVSSLPLTRRYCVESSLKIPPGCLDSSLIISLSAPHHAYSLSFAIWLEDCSDLK